MAFISNGTTILDNGAFNVSLGGLILLSETTASASASIEFTSGIDSTYDIYKFEFVNIHPADYSKFEFNLSTDGGSNYNVTKTASFFRPTIRENNSDAGLAYSSSNALQQSTSFQPLTQGLGEVAVDNDASASGYLFLFNPSSTTYVKHFIGEIQHMHNNDYSMDAFVAGYGNTTSAINAIKFQASTGNIDDGTIKMYGIKGS